MQQEFPFRTGFLDFGISDLSLCEWAGRDQTDRSSDMLTRLLPRAKKLRLKASKVPESHRKKVFFLAITPSNSNVAGGQHTANAWPARPDTAFYKAKTQRNTHAGCWFGEKDLLCFLSWWCDEPPAPYTSRTAEPKRCCAQLLPLG